MATFTLMSSATAFGPAGTTQLSPVSVPGNPLRASYTFTIGGPTTEFAGCTILASVDGQTFLPLLTMTIEPFGPNSVTVFNSETPNYIQYDAQLNYISPAGNMATVVMTV